LFFIKFIFKNKKLKKIKNEYKIISFKRRRQRIFPANSQKRRRQANNFGNGFERHVQKIWVGAKSQGISVV
jgi:hypothetical protein